jgi:hypothetical protein
MNPEHLIAELVSKLHSGVLDPHGPNTEDDVRSIVMKHFKGLKNESSTAEKKTDLAIWSHGYCDPRRHRP